MALVWRERFEAARASAALAVAGVGGAWIAAQWPDLLPGAVSIEAGAANDATLTTMLIGLVIGLAILIPSLAWLFRLVLRGRLDKEFHPMTAGEPEK
jgi:cytochrome d ubiquinol oxidase subunit II